MKTRQGTQKAKKHRDILEDFENDDSNEQVPKEEIPHLNTKKEQGTTTQHEEIITLDDDMKKPVKPGQVTRKQPKRKMKQEDAAAGVVQAEEPCKKKSAQTQPEKKKHHAKAMESRPRATLKLTDRKTRTSSFSQKRTGMQRKYVSRTERAGLTFPVGRIHRQLKHACSGSRFSSGAPVYLAATMEYLVRELFIMSDSATRANGKKTIKNKFIQLAAKMDPGFSILWKNVTVPEGRVVPHIERALVNKTKQSNKKTKSTPRITHAELKNTIAAVASKHALALKEANSTGGGGVVKKSGDDWRSWTANVTRSAAAAGKSKTSRVDNAGIQLERINKTLARIKEMESRASASSSLAFDLDEDEVELDLNTPDEDEPLELPEDD